MSVFCVCPVRLVNNCVSIEARMEVRSHSDKAETSLRIVMAREAMPPIFNPRVARDFSPAQTDCVGPCEPEGITGPMKLGLVGTIDQPGPVTGAARRCPGPAPAPAGAGATAAAAAGPGGRGLVGRNGAGTWVRARIFIASAALRAAAAIPCRDFSIAWSWSAPSNLNPNSAYSSATFTLVFWFVQFRCSFHILIAESHVLPCRQHLVRRHRPDLSRRAEPLFPESEDQHGFIVGGYSDFGLSDAAFAPVDNNEPRFFTKGRRLAFITSHATGR